MAKRTDNDILISSPDILFRYCVDILVVMTALLIAGTYLNGLNAIRTSLCCVFVSAFLENIACRIMKRNDRKVQTLYAAATGLAVSLMLPAAIPTYIAAIASAFAVVAVLIPFGSGRKIPFVPAAAGICFVTVCFPAAVFAYAPISIGKSSPVFGSENFVGAEAFSKMLTYGKSVILNPLETISVLMGKNPGPMGTTCMLVLIGAAIYLLLKRKESFAISFSFFAACALYAALFPRVNSGAVSSIVMELSAGMLIFAGLILLPDPFTSPKNTPGKILYGIFAGLICMLLRRYGAFEESVCFTILIMNAVAPAVKDYFDSLADSMREKGIIKERKIKFASADSVSNHKKDKSKKKKTSHSKKKNSKRRTDNSSNEEYKSIDHFSYDDLMKFDDDDETPAEDKVEMKEGESGGE